MMVMITNNYNQFVYIRPDVDHGSTNVGTRSVCMFVVVVSHWLVLLYRRKKIISMACDFATSAGGNMIDRTILPGVTAE